MWIEYTDLQIETWLDYIDQKCLGIEKGLCFGSEISQWLVRKVTIYLEICLVQSSDNLLGKQLDYFRLIRHGNLMVMVLLRQQLFSLIFFSTFTTEVGCSGEIPSFRVSHPLYEYHLYIYRFEGFIFKDNS